MTYFTDIKENNNNLIFKINNNDEIKLSFANAIRRIIIANIPIYAIDEESIVFNNNTSMLHDSFLSKRLALLPVVFDKMKDYDINNIKISLNIKNNNDYMLNVYSNDLNITYNNEPIENIFTHSNILLAKLKQEQEIDLTCNINKNSPESGGAYYGSVCKSIITFERDEDLINNIVKDVDNKEQYINVMGETHYKKNKLNEPVKYICDIESIGMLKCNKIITFAFNVLKEKLDNIKISLNENIENKIKIDKNDKNFESFDFLMVDEDHTLGNLISSYLLNNPQINYSGYIIPHPNDNKMIITTELKNDNTIEGNKKIFLETLDYLLNLTDKLLKEWDNSNSVSVPKTKKIIKKKSK